jgi:hypothetical protein
MDGGVAAVVMTGVGVEGGLPAVVMTGARTTGDLAAAARVPVLPRDRFRVRAAASGAAR